MIFDDPISDERFRQMSFKQQIDYIEGIRRDLDIVERVRNFDYTVTDEEFLECFGDDYVEMIDKKIREENEHKTQVSDTTPKTLDYRDYLT